MPGIPSTVLFDLIQSLSKSEKRHFNIFASRHVIGEKNLHVRLFSIIEKQSRYDENKVLKKAAITKQQLKGRKNYLYELILKSLGVYHLEGNAERKINKIVKHAKIIFEKGLYQQCLKLFVKAKQLAVKYEKHLLLIEILTWEEATLRGMYDIQKLEKHIENSFREREQALERLAIINRYGKLYLKNYLLVTKEGILRNSAYRKQFAILSEHPFIKDKKLATSYRARLEYYRIQSLHQRVLGKLESCYDVNMERVIFIEQHPHQITEDPSAYMNALQNLSAICLELDKREELMNTLKKLRGLPVKTESLQNKIFAFSYQFELSYYIKYVYYQKGIDIVPAIKKGMERIGDKFDKQYQLHFHFNFTVLYFAIKDYRNALKWQNIILNNPEKELRKDIYCFVRILNLIIHYEMGNQLLMKSAVRSTYRFLYKNKRLFALETVILKFIRNKMSKLNTQKQIIKAFQELRKELIEVTKDDFEKRSLEYFDIISWLESKIENKSFEEIARQKVGSLPDSF